MIPKVIHRVWLGGEEPEWLQRFASTWSRPGWQIWQWTDANVATLFPLRNQALFERAAAIAGEHAGQLRCDVLRYEILHRHGGVYVDADFECLKPLDDLLVDVEAFAAWEEPQRWINNAILGAQEGDPLLDRLIQRLPANVRRKRGQRPNVLSGPQFITSIRRTHGRHWTIFDRELFYPYAWNELDRGAESYPNAYAVHHWSNARRRREEPLAA